jgi:hypothetical protein
VPQEFEGDLTEAVFWGADLSGARFRDVNLTGVRISHAMLVDVDIDAPIDKLVINGVDVTAYVNERDPWFPLRSVLRFPTTPDDLRSSWKALEGEWAKTTARARALPEAKLQESVNGEFSFVETVRHLVFAMDKWFVVPVLGDAFSPIGLPNKGSLDYPWPGLDYGLRPSAAEVLAVHGDRATRYREFLASVTASDLTRPIDVLENGEHPLLPCLHTVIEETFWHNRYAVRDLALLEAIK